MKKFLSNEIYLYIIFGIITSIINIVIFYILNIIIDYKVSNIIALIVAKLSAYVLNKKYVFKSKCSNYKELIKEFVSFIIFRGLTLIIDYFGLILLVELFKLNKLISKILITILVIIVNYFTGKKYVFKKNIDK